MIPTTADDLASVLLKLRNRHFLAFDIVLLLLTPLLALELRTDGAASYTSSLLVITISFLSLKLTVFYLLGIYSLYWRYASIDELAQIARAWLLVLVLQTLVFFAVLRPAGWVVPDFPRSVPLIEGLLALIAIGASRYSLRLVQRLRQKANGHSNGKRVLVVGAGDAGIRLVEELQRSPQLDLHPVGFIDDDPTKLRSRIRGVTVLGSRRDIPRLIRETRASQVIIAMPAAPGKEIREILSICERERVVARIMPGIYELLGGTASINQLRTVQIEDLLRREPVNTDIAAVRELIRGKRVLITGAGGSIGSELCRQVLRCAPAQLILLGHGENSIFAIYRELQAQLEASRPTAHHTPSELLPLIADIRFPSRLQSIFEEHRPEIVFHAAAHKHVPLMEQNPVEAITNNILGTRNLLDAALLVGTGRFVMISSDKAVNPTGIMGASKRVAELLVHQAAEQSGRPYVAVRFGNVLGSRGSVLHIFKQQIASGGPITVTHPEMRRYFMLIPEAVQLVLQAAILGRGGEVFMLDMGEPIRIVDLARDMVELSGLELGRDIQLAFTGLRPGEKLFEELFSAGEEYQPTCHDKIFIACHASNSVPSFLPQAIVSLEAAAAHEDRARVFDLLQQVLPEFQPRERSAVPDGGFRTQSTAASPAMADLLAARRPA